MSSSDTPAATPEPSAHALAIALAERVCGANCDAAHAAARAERAPRVLVAGAGSGRNLSPLRAAGCEVVVVEPDAARADAAARRVANDPRVRIAVARYDDAAAVAAAAASDARRCDGALSTHALLHGDARGVAGALAAIRGALRDGAPLYATFGSTRDPRYGTGRRLDARTWAPEDGPEAGVPHVYFDARELREVLREFTIESQVETAAAEHVGRWAHDDADAATIVHWFVRATARPLQ